MNIAASLIDQLIQQDVIEFSIAPGSRSTPLALAAARHPKARVTVHFDERGLAFYALGLSLAQKTPAAIIVTSGTAVGNLMPAVMEAFHSRVPLILLTADRPNELRDCSANQTTDQIHFFQKFSLWQSDLPCEASEEFIRAQASYAVFNALRKGPVHLNCPFREPLYEPSSPLKEGIAQPLFLPTPSFHQQEECKPFLKKRGIILIGKMPFGTPLGSLFHFAQQLGWPIFADLLSGARAALSPEELIDHFDYAVRSKEAPLPEQIIHFGGRFTSKTLLEWIKNNKIETLQVSSDHERMEPLHAARVWAEPESFCKAFSCFPEKDLSWLPTWQQMDRLIKNHLETCFSEPHPFTEPDLMRAIGEQLPENWGLFLANSMPIRDAEHFLFPKNAFGFFANRGLSGIDGQIATAAGIAARLKKPLCVILGDQSCLHDLNSLPLLHTIKTPFLLIISNNFGGGIFSHLPVAKEPDHFERLFGNPHDYLFEKAAEMFHIPYRRVEKIDRLFNFSTPSILEICTSREENKKFRDKLGDRCFSLVF